jgi:hypothetical protein
LLDFVNNVNFSLDYTEFDFGANIDGKKGEIQVDNFNISYINSNNTFKASNSINEAISDEINNDSGVTNRYSNNLYYDMSLNYTFASDARLANTLLFFKNVSSTSEDVGNMYTAGLIMFSTCGLLEIAIIIYLISRCIKGSSDKFLIVTLACILICFIPLGYLISLATEVRGYISGSLK